MTIRPNHPNAARMHQFTAFDILSLIDEIDSDCDNDAIQTAIAILCLPDAELLELRKMLQLIDPDKPLADATDAELAPFD